MARAQTPLRSSARWSVAARGRREATCSSIDASPAGNASAVPGTTRTANGASRAAGVEETEWQDDPGFTRVQVRHPDGWRVELFAY
jgi:hypothetical protein